MGQLINGGWYPNGYETESKKGDFVRKASSFRHWITKDGQAGPTGDAGFKAEPHRYHLYVSLACPWAHRTLIYRALKGLEEMISISVVNPLMEKDGWSFLSDDGVIPDPFYQARFLHHIYTQADPDYTGNVTVPILWDKKTHTIVSNESADIIRMFNDAFDDVGAAKVDFYPLEKQPQINEINDFIYPTINNGVYRAGFATTQEAYTLAVTELFDALDTVEKTLSQQRYLTGSEITEADWRLFTTLVRFDPVYVGHFKCNLQRIVDYPNLWGYVRDLYQVPKIAETVNMTHIKAHYYRSHNNINPTGIVPKGPNLDFLIPHDRDTLDK